VAAIHAGWCGGPGHRGTGQAVALAIVGGGVCGGESSGVIFEDLELLRHALLNARGMILLSGPTGSGKTTTLYALLQELQGNQRAIVTIEDPVECLVDGITQIQVNKKQGLNYAEGARGLLRLDPDVILSFAFQMSSRRKANQEMPRPVFEANLRQLFPGLEELPHQDTLARLLARIDVNEIEAAHLDMIRQLIRGKKSGRYLISITGTS
jgi:hypothetical protein